ncbi:dynamin family protein [Arenicella xantha]|uniref:dynamin family protein n=1 Tax=Arenicella xantha TaxID=644221 RepID=UPI000DE93286|nr:dynamin family protein [Arenicella xantha]
MPSHTDPKTSKTVTEQILNTEIEQYSEWRQSVSQAVQDLSTFLKAKNVTDLRTHHQFENVLGALADDNLSVAFVAEFSRGKSEMINTIFFGNYKKRILPSGSGRTTMCPTELMYDPNLPSSVRLLPIESRKDERALFELKKDRELWHEIKFDADDVDSVSDAMQGMTDNKLVSKAYAKELKFDLLEEKNAELGLPVNEYDEVEIPSWRHAIINLPHPLLEQGLVILDTPGLNAIGAEPELTINQLATAHTVVFILSLDTGVTATDLELWQQHLDGEKSGVDRNQRKLVALNKIDALWDGIRSDIEIQNEIDAQVRATAKTLNLDPRNIFPVSAQKGLVAKLTEDDELLAKSNIPALENAIASKLIPEKRKIVVEKVRGALETILESASSIMDNRLKDADEHIAELKQLSSKNTDVISHIMLKVQGEKSSLEKDMQRYQALRAVYSKETTKLVQMLSGDRLEKLIAITKHNMARCASSITLQKTISKFFERLNYYLDSSINQANEIAALSENITRDFEQDHGIANFKVRRLRLEKFKQEVNRLEVKHRHLKDTRTLFFREQMSITNRFYDSVCQAARKIFSQALRDATNWNNNLMVPMETYVREHHTQLRRRLESVKRIHKASDTVEQRLQELTVMQSQLVEQHTQFTTYQTQLTGLIKEAEEQNKPNEKEESPSADILYWDHKVNF